MLRSDDPCAIATTLTPAVASDENARAATPGVPTMPSPTTATTAMPGRDVTLSMRPLASSSWNARSIARTARSASASGSVNPIELSDDAWKIVETDRRSASTADERAGGDAVHAGHALAGHGDDRLPAHDRQRLDRMRPVGPAGRDLRARLIGIDERPHAQHDARAGNRDERARMQDLGAVVRDLCGLAMMELRDQPRVGDETRIRGQNAGHVFPEHHLVAAPSARASSVAVRSDPPRPSVVTLPSGATADESGHDRRQASRQERPQRPSCTPSRLRRGRRGAAMLAVRGDDIAGIHVTSPGGRLPSTAAARIAADSRSPRETSMSLARGSR